MSGVNTYSFAFSCFNLRSLILRSVSFFDCLSKMFACSYILARTDNFTTITAWPSDGHTLYGLVVVCACVHVCVRQWVMRVFACDYVVSLRVRVCAYISLWLYVSTKSTRVKGESLLQSVRVTQYFIIFHAKHYILRNHNSLTKWCNTLNAYGTDWKQIELILLWCSWKYSYVWLSDWTWFQTQCSVSFDTFTKHVDTLNHLRDTLMILSHLSMAAIV